MDKALVILAAGAGSRYGGIKQLAPIGPGGATLLEYSVYDAIQAGFTQVVLVIRREHETTFRTCFDTGMARKAPLSYVFQDLDDLPTGFEHLVGRHKPWGTVHAVLAAADVLTGSFAVANADDFYGAGSFATLANFLQSCVDQEVLRTAVVAFEVGQTLTDSGPVSRALCHVGPGGDVQQIQEIKQVWRNRDQITYRDLDDTEKPLDPKGLVSMNMWGFPRQILPELRQHFRHFLHHEGQADSSECLLPDAARAMIKNQSIRLQILRGSGPWCGLTFPQDQPGVSARLSKLVAEGKYPRALWSSRPRTNP